MADRSRPREENAKQEQYDAATLNDTMQRHQLQGNDTLHTPQNYKVEKRFGVVAMNEVAEFVDDNILNTSFRRFYQFCI